MPGERILKPLTGKNFGNETALQHIQRESHHEDIHPNPNSMRRCIDYFHDRQHRPHPYYQQYLFVRSYFSTGLV